MLAACAGRDKVFGKLIAWSTVMGDFSLLLVMFFLMGVMSCAQQPSAEARPLWDHFSTYRNYVKIDEPVGADERNYFSDKTMEDARRVEIEI